MVLQRFVVYAFDVHKLKISFKNSMYEIKNYIVIPWYGVLMISCIGYYISIYYFNDVHTFFGERFCGNAGYIRIIFIVFAVLDVLFAFILTRMLTKRLRFVLEIKHLSKIASVYKKLKILCVMAIISSLIFILASKLNPFTQGYELLSIDLVINNACLIFTFAKTMTIYHSCCKCTLFKCNKKKGISKVNIGSASPPPPRTPSPKTIEVELQTTQQKKSKNKADKVKVIKRETSKKSTLHIPKKTLTMHTLTVPMDGDITHTSQNSVIIPDLLDITIKKQKSHDPQSSLSNFIDEFNPKQIPTHPQSNSITIFYGNNNNDITTFEASEFNINNLALDLKDIDSSYNVDDDDDETPKLCSINLRELGIII